METSKAEGHPDATFGSRQEAPLMGYSTSQETGRVQCFEGRRCPDLRLARARRVRYCVRGQKWSRENEMNRYCHFSSSSSSSSCSILSFRTYFLRSTPFSCPSFRATLTLSGWASHPSSKRCQAAGPDDFSRGLRVIVLPICSNTILNKHIRSTLLRECITSMSESCLLHHTEEWRLSKQGRTAKCVAKHNRHVDHFQRSTSI